MISIGTNIKIILYSIISEKIIDKNKQEFDINIVLFLNLIFIIYALKK